MAIVIPFEAIEERARARLGGAQALVDRLPVPKSASDLRAVPDDRYLSEMSRRIFRAGLKYSLVDGKWPAFEEVFLGFAPKRVVAMSDDELEALLEDKRLIRHWGKLKSVRANAAAITRLRSEAGGIGAWLAGWPRDDVVGVRLPWTGGNYDVLRSMQWQVHGYGVPERAVRRIGRELGVEAHVFPRDPYRRLRVDRVYLVRRDGFVVAEVVSPGTGALLDAARRRLAGE